MTDERPEDQNEENMPEGEETMLEADMASEAAEKPADDQAEPEMDSVVEQTAPVEEAAEDMPEVEEISEEMEAPTQEAAPEPVVEQESEAVTLAEESSDEEEDIAAQAAMVEEPDDGRAWYVVHCYSGQENKVRHNLEQRIESMDMKGFIYDVVVPTEEEIEVKEGKRRTVERRVFPGYVLVNMLLTEESWYVVRNTPGVTGFVGMGNDPTPLRPDEVSQIIKRMEADAPRIKVTFKPDERVRIVDGPFNDFHGVVDEIDMDRAKVRVMVNFFGRETPVELDFLQVEKA
jgi:transcriptional antiterminator NusG